MAQGLSAPAAPGLSEDQARGLALACSSAVFIGSSFIIKKKGLRVAGASGTRAGALKNFLAQFCTLLCACQCDTLLCCHLCSAGLSLGNTPGLGARQTNVFRYCTQTLHPCIE